MDSKAVYRRGSGTKWRGRRKWKKTKPYNSPKAEDLDVILGRWKVVKVYYEVYDDKEEGHSDASVPLVQPPGQMGDLVYEVPLPECKGVHVVFDDQCDVTWEVPNGVEPILLYQTTSYNIEKDSLDLIGGSDGRTFNFYVEQSDEDGDVICLKTPVSGEGEDPDDDTEEGNMMIVLERVKTAPAPEVEAFTMKEALDEKFFSDLTVRSSDGVTFNIHRTVLDCCSPNMGYREWEMYLSTLKATLLKVTLNYIYCGTLPPDMTVQLAKELSESISTHPKLSRLAELCKTFIASHDLKQRLIQLVDDIQAMLEQAKKVIANTEMTNPVKVTYTIKQLAKEAAVAATKFGLLCELYTRNKKEMNKKEKHEVLEYMRGRVVVFVDLLSELIELALEKYNSLSDEQKMETATYIIPEVGWIWNLVNVTCGDIQTALLTRGSSHKKSGLRKQDIKLSIILQFAAKGRELKRMQRIGKEFEEFVEVSQKKREEFEGWSENEKVEKIIRAMVGIKQEGEHQMKQLQEVKMEILMENALDWKKFKILVAVCCSYVSWGLRKLQALREPLKPALLKACKFVQRSEVNDALLYFNILEEDDLKQIREHDDYDDDQSIGAVGGKNHERVLKDKMPGLEPINVSESQLAKGCLKLLDSHQHSDMEFILEGSVLPETTPTDDDVTSNQESVVIQAHRVIVASRCEWLKRALQSGMKEAINKRIVIHGCDESVFRTFLHYLYGGNLDTIAMSLDDIIELLAVADHYETTSLRVMCEGVLVERVEDSNVFLLLQVADRYSTRKLREATLQHVLSNPDVVMTELDGYSSLPDDLKQELRSLLSATATTDPHLLLRHLQGPSTQEENDSRTSSHSSSGSSGSSSQAHVPADEFFQVDEQFHHPNTVAFQAAMDKLRGILGEGVSEELLKDVLMAADMDVNRALNFYFNTQTD